MVFTANLLFTQNAESEPQISEAVKISYLVCNRYVRMANPSFYPCFLDNNICHSNKYWVQPFQGPNQVISLQSSAIFLHESIFKYWSEEVHQKLTERWSMEFESVELVNSWIRRANSYQTKTLSEQWIQPRLQVSSYVVGEWLIFGGFPLCTFDV